MNGEEIDLSYEFGAFRLEPATRRLLREGEALPLTPKAFDTLLLLVQNRERVMEKEELLRRIWPDAVVEESNLAQNVFTLRKTLGDSPEGARFIATVPRRGYRFVAPVTHSRAMAATLHPAPTVEEAARPWSGRVVKLAVAALAVLLLPLAGYFAGRRATTEPAQPKLTRLTFRRGIVRRARFAPDGRTVVYSALWDGYPSQLFLSRPDSPESMTLDAPSADLMAVSSSGELALALRPSLLQHQMGEFNTLARTPLMGGVPREVLGTAERCMNSIRVSRDGKLVAFVACAKPEFSVVVVNGEGRPRTLWTGRECVSGLAWSPRGDEVWFTTEAQGRLPQVRAVDLSGRSRVLGQVPGVLSDVSRDGGVLITTGRRLLIGGRIAEREGRLYVLDTSGGGALRPITPEMTGVGAVSPDGKWVATIGDDGHFIYPVDGGERRPLAGMERDEWPVGWSADGGAIYIRREGNVPLPVLRVDVRTGAKEIS
jgi:DNA-binding winged helix-turn-helix (wHTH) protein